MRKHDYPTLSEKTTRRGFIQKLSIAAAAVPVACAPVAAVANRPRTAREISDRIHELGWEIADLLKEQGEDRYAYIRAASSPTAVFIGKVYRED